MEKIPAPIGRALHGLRSGMEHTLYQEDASAGIPMTILVTSSAFADGSAMDAKFTQDGPKLSPPLAWKGAPPAARALVLLIEDADSPTPRPIVHALIPDLGARDGELREGALGERYRAPDPPPGHGPHRYVFQVYALREAPPPLKDKGDLRKVLENGEGLAKGRVIATYERR